MTDLTRLELVRRGRPLPRDLPAELAFRTTATVAVEKGG